MRRSPTLPIQVTIRESKWTRTEPFMGPLTREQADYRSRQLFDHDVSHWLCERTIWTDSPEFLALPKFMQKNLIAKAKRGARIPPDQPFPLRRPDPRTAHLSLMEQFGPGSGETLWQAIKGDLSAMFKRWTGRD